MPQLRGRLDEIRDRMARAAARSGRIADRIVLIGVAKGVAPGTIQAALEAGLEDVAENRVQEAEAVSGVVGRRAARWHMIGSLQRNKAARAVDLFDWIHSVDRLELATALSRHAALANRTLPVLVQVNIGAEATKHGVAPNELEPRLERLAGLPGLRLEGLMCIAPVVDHPELARPYFRRMRELRDQAMRALRIQLPELSMGMSDDFEIGIEEGSTMVRIGTALFGQPS